MASYRRDVLLEYGDELARKFETSVDDALGDAPGRSPIRHRAGCLSIFHQNHSRLLPSIPLRFQTGRLFAANRTASWSPRAT